MTILGNLLWELVAVTVTSNAAEAKAGSVDTWAFHDTHVNEVTNCDTIAANLADGGKTMGESVPGLLDCACLLLSNGLDNPVVIVVGQVAGEVQVGIDKTWHNGAALDVADLIALWNLSARTSISDLLVVYEDKRILNRSGASAVNELSAYKSNLTHFFPPLVNDTYYLFAPTLFGRKKSKLKKQITCLVQRTDETFRACKQLMLLPSQTDDQRS